MISRKTQYPPGLLACPLWLLLGQTPRVNRGASANSYQTFTHPVDKLLFFLYPSFFAVVSGLIKQRSRTSRNVRSVRLNNWAKDNAIFVRVVHVLPQSERQTWVSSPQSRSFSMGRQFSTSQWREWKPGIPSPQRYQNQDCS